MEDGDLLRSVGARVHPGWDDDLYDADSADEDLDDGEYAAFYEDVEEVGRGYGVEEGWSDKLEVREKKEPKFETFEQSRMYQAEMEDSSVDFAWLLQVSQGVVVKTGTEMTEFELARAIVLELASKESDDVLQGHLFDVVGDFDAVERILRHRNQLSPQAQSLLDQIDLLSSGPSSTIRGNGVHERFTTRTEADKRAAKTMRKLQNKLRHQTRVRDAQLPQTLGQAIKVPPGEGETPLERMESIALALKLSTSSTETSANLGPDRAALPVGTERKVHKNYEEYYVPPSKRLRPEQMKRIKVESSLDEISRIVFEGVESLNPIQSAVYETAYKTNENMLVCAPTGAGKTNIALLTVLREVGLHVRNGVVDLDAFKVVYVAPMKALAAEVCEKFSERLGRLKIQVRELTGDMQLTKAEAAATQVIVTTPEKWDVITRKAVPGSGNALTEVVKLLIIDEVHLLHDERGAVLESIVARTLRTVEAQQSMIRLVGLSATLPNYKDVGSFLRVNEGRGLFFFDQKYRPVPLSQTFIGVSERDQKKRDALITKICYEKVANSIRDGNQAMVFVHTRKGTVQTARNLLDLSTEESTSDSCLFLPAQFVGKKAREDAPEAAVPKIPSWAEQLIAKAKSSEIRELCARGIGIHHAGLLRPDRKIVEKLFSEGVLRCLVCTATLAWGVNLPARTVVIKGTDIYDPKRGGFVDIGMLDVMQIFGRAGRPQFDTQGEGIIITTHDKLSFYLRFLTASLPIESQLMKSSALVDHLNAEIVLGTISNVREGAEWLGYTYLKVRMGKNPLAYGIGWEFAAVDPDLLDRRREMIEVAAKKLDEARMVRFDPETGSVGPTDLGRVASHFYVSLETIEMWNERLQPDTDEIGLLRAVSASSEFEQLRLREEETDEICKLVSLACPIEISGGFDSEGGKINVLLQSFISRAKIQSFTLISDSNYVQQNASRMLQAILEISLKKGWPGLSFLALELCRAAEQQVWAFQSPLRQVPRLLQLEVAARLEQLGRTGELENLLTLSHSELTSLVRSPKVATSLQRAMSAIPILNVEATASPVSRTVLRIRVALRPAFTWIESVHGPASSPIRWHLWVEDCDQERIYHYERIAITRKQMNQDLELVLLVPVFDPPSPQYSIRVLSTSWQGGDSYYDVSLREVKFPDRQVRHTPLLDLRPLPKSALQDAKIEKIYRFAHFNPVQTQIFHVLYHQRGNVLVGAPTGSGKTVAAELAMLRSFRENPGGLVVYIGPLKALVRERILDWDKKIRGILGKNVVELTGDTTPEPGVLDRAHLICTTPEKWDGVSRSWLYRSYVRRTSLIVIDEVHLLGADRGPVLEIIVSRLRRTNPDCRIVALSTALANATELADWLAVEYDTGLFNFRPSVRPVPCEAHVLGVAGELYCPRMNAMNRPAYTAICRYSPSKPVLVFVSSRRQTRLTAMELIRLAAVDGNPRRFARDPSANYTDFANRVMDSSLRQTIEFGVGIHHAGLPSSDRTLVEKLYLEGKLMILVSTSTLAWGVNLPAHLVVVKGTEFYDAKQRKYIDMPVTDILQMMGRAGRPQFDDRAYAVILVQDSKKSFYKKFVYDPFPVESTLHLQLTDHVNAEIASGSVKTAQDAVDSLTWTYLFRRVSSNPSYYGVRDASAAGLSEFFSTLVETTLLSLQEAGCISMSYEAVQISDLDEIERCRALEPRSATTSDSLTSSMSSYRLKSLKLTSTFLGTTSSNYYLCHRTVKLFNTLIGPNSTIERLLRCLTDSEEYGDLPVRHNEDKLNEGLAEDVIEFLEQFETGNEKDDVRKRLRLFPDQMGSPHVKALLLLVAHMGRLPLPITDYFTDTRTALDNSGRLLQAMMDIAAEKGYLNAFRHCLQLQQSLIQGLTPWDSPFRCLPEWSTEMELALNECNAWDLLDLARMDSTQISHVAGTSTGLRQALSKASVRIPTLEVDQPEAHWLNDSEGIWQISFHLEVKRMITTKSKGAFTTSAFAKDLTPESWIATVVDEKQSQILAMRRLPPVVRNLGSKLQIPENRWPLNADLRLIIWSACYPNLSISRELIKPSGS